jgi:anti-sigma regulatory factor (Ser/Thr protein kinase)
MSEKMMKTAAQVCRWPEVMAFVDELLEENNCPFRAQMQIEISLEEMFVNIAHYAYPDGDGWAEVHVRVTDKGAEITLVDGGIPYNPLDKEDPDVTLSVEEREVGGLGIFLVKKTMDDMTYVRRDGRNELTIRKRI